MTTVPNNEERSLRAYLESQRIDPVQRQLNEIYLQIIQDIDNRRITSKDRHALQQFVTQQNRMEVFVPRLPRTGRIDEVRMDNPLANTQRIGNTYYQRFNLRPLHTYKDRPEPKLTFPIFDPRDPMSPGYIHRQSVSIADQAALPSLHNHRIHDQLKYLEDVAKSRPTYIEKVGIKNGTIREHINSFGNNLTVTRVPNPQRPDALETLRQLSRSMTPGPLSPRSVPSLEGDSEEEMYFSEPDTKGFKGLGKRKIPPTPTPDDVVWNQSRAGPRAWEGFTKKQIIASIEWRFPEMTSDEVHEMNRIRNRPMLLEFGDRLADKKANSGRTSPIQPRGFPSSSSSGILGMTTPTKYAKGKKAYEGRQRKTSPWKEMKGKGKGRG